MIKKVVLENWKTHQNSEFEFGKGTNVIIGKVGSGKSSIMDAISYCLFGTFPALNNKRISTEETIMNRPNKMEQAKLKMEFSYNNKEYRLERTIKRQGTNEAMLYLNNKLIAGPKTSDVNRTVENEMEITFELFSRAVYSEQNQMDYFLRMNPGQRKEKFDELLELDKYEKARSNAVTATNRIKQSIQDKQKFLAEIKAEERKEGLKEMEKRKHEKQNRTIELQKTKKETEQAVKTFEEETKKLQNKQKEHRQLSELLLKAKARIEETEKEIHKTEKQLQGKEGKQIEQEIKQAKQDAEKNKKQAEKKEEQVQGEQEKLKTTEKQTAVNNTLLTQLSKSHLELEKAEGKCPFCNRELETKTKKQLLEHSRLEEKQIMEKNLQLEKAKKETEKQITSLKQEQKSLQEKAEALREKSLQMEHVLEKAKTHQEKKEALKSLQQETEKLEQTIKQLEFSEQELEEKTETLVEKKSLQQKIMTEIESNGEIIQEIEKTIQETQKTIRQAEETEKQIAGMQKAVENITVFVNALKAAQSELRETLIETINNAMEDIWPKIYPYQDIVSARMTIEEGSYELKVKRRNSEWERVEGILSGGERSAAAICIRIAFSLVLTQNLSWIILDEPTHNLDITTVNALAEMLKNYLPEIVEQIFVITHDRELEKAASATIFVLHREKNEDGITAPEQLPLIS